MGLDEMLKSSAAFDPSGLSTESISGIAASQAITMPLPIVRPGTSDITVTKDGVKLSETYKDFYYDLDPAYKDSYDPSTGLDFSEWGMPKDALHEQFYIAMKWPYKVGEAGSKAREAFNSAYNFSDEDLVGTVQEYKKRKVLVYNENTKQAVVCAPAYFLWGETDIDAIVSPDAAYFLGLLIKDNGKIVFPSENLPDNLDNKTQIRADGDKQYDTIGSQELDLVNCRFTFVHDSTPLGVVTSSVNQAKTLTLKSFDRLKGDISDMPSSNSMIIGFGSFRNVEDKQNLDQIFPEATD
jgi:hypothetical protein